MLIAVLAASGLSSCVSAPGTPAVNALPPAKVLFVGNSFTYYNNSLHGHFRQLTRAAEIFPPGSSRARILTISGGRLPEHAGGFEHVLGTDEWDVVVMQGHSLGPISEDTAEPFREAARKFARIARKRGVRPAFFMTWAYTDKPEMTAQLDKAYSDIGRELDAQVVPVGLAFARATKERPDLDLRTDDLRHPSMAGTYLAACTFFAALYNQSPEGLEYDAGLGKATASYLQQLAWETVRTYADRESAWSFTNRAGAPVPVTTFPPTMHYATIPAVIVVQIWDRRRQYSDWLLNVVDGTDHDNAKMAPAAAALIRLLP